MRVTPRRVHLSASPPGSKGASTRVRARSGRGRPPVSPGSGGTPRRAPGGGAFAPALAGWIERLPPNALAFVMATGIVSVGAAKVGQDALSAAFLAVACAGFAVLVPCYALHVLRHPDRLRADFAGLTRPFGFFTIVASANVLASRLAGIAPLAAVVLAIAGAAVWVALDHVVPAALMLRRRRAPATEHLDGGVLLWVVGTQSIVVANCALAATGHGVGDALTTAVAGVWALGAALYLVLIVLIVARLIEGGLEPAALSPTYWIAMGGAAITVLAGAGLLGLPGHPAIVQATRSAIEAAVFALWAVGTWWIPMLLALGVWRHVVRGVPFAYEAAMWSIVFPLGMYGTATLALGEVARLALLTAVGRAEIGFAFVAWAGVLALMVGAAARDVRSSGRRS